MAVRSRWLGQVRDVSLGVRTDVFQVPAERTAVVRRWSVTNRATVSTHVVLEVRTAAGLVQIWRGNIAGETTVVAEDTNLVLDPGMALVVIVPAAAASGAVHVAASGSLLNGAPV